MTSQQETPIDQFTTEFRQNGFVCAKGLLDLGEIARLAQVVDEAVVARKKHDHRNLSEKSAYEQSFIQCQYLWEDFPEVRALTFHPAICEMAAQLVGAEKLRIWHDQALYKESGGRETEAHQDQAYWPIAERDAVTAWVPLCSVTDACGPMGYIPGSHNSNVRFVDIFNATGDGDRLREDYAGTKTVFIPCEPGDVIFHHGHTVHMAKQNTSNVTRRVYTAIYFRDGCTRSDKSFHPSVDRDRIAVGEAINGSATPVVWPLNDGLHPVPAAWPNWDDDRSRWASQMGVIPERKR